MTLAELQPYVEDALSAVEWNAARLRWASALDDEEAAIRKAVPLAGQYGVELEPLEARLEQIAIERQGDVTADRVPQSPLRSVPMDLVTTAVVRRLLRLPAEFPVLSIKSLPEPQDLAEAVAAIAARWQTPNGQLTYQDTVNG